MDLASIIGLIVCFGMLVFGIIDAGGFAAVGSYLDFPSALITFGGSFAAVLTQYSLSEYIAGFKSITLVFKMPNANTAEVIQKIIELSNVARKEGLLSLEEAAADLEEAFLRKGILLIVDGTDPELVRAIMETELMSLDDRHKSKIGFWDNIASMGPAWGMIGTLVGLVNMLKKLSDPSALGPQMAVALITTFYGSVLANWLATPISNKLKANNEAEYRIKVIMIEGLLSIQAGENPRVIAEKLKSFLAPAQRASLENENGGGEAVG